MLLSIINHILLTAPVWKRTWFSSFSALFIVGTLLLLPQAVYATTINASTLITLTNKERVKYNLPELVPNHELTSAAHKKALDMLTEGYFAHTTPKGKPFYEWIDEAGYQYLYAGENLAIDFTTNEATVDAWMASSLHRANILNEHYNDIGLVVVRGLYNDHETSIVVQLFGSLLADSPTVLGEALESLTIDLGIRRESLKTLAADLVMLPSIAGSRYFDILVSPNRSTNLVATQANAASIAAHPTTKIVQGSPYQTLLKTKTDCCAKDATFALTEEKNGVLLSTPISFPSVSAFITNVGKRAVGFPNFSRTISVNMLTVGLLILLLLAAYEQDIRKKLQIVRK
jgi:hypothetical protein